MLLAPSFFPGLFHLSELSDPPHILYRFLFKLFLNGSLLLPSFVFFFFHQVDRLLADRLRAKLAGDFTGADVLRQELADNVCSIIIVL